MKKILISMLAVAALVSCSKEESILVDQGEAIAFGNAFVDNATRAAVDPSYGTANPLTSFKVYGAVEGVNIFSGANVTKGDAAYGAAWGCDGKTQYWIAGADYIFDAVVDGTVKDPDAAGLPTALSYAIADQKDMLHQRVTTVGKPTSNNGLVAFTFTHLLSKVKLSIENTTPNTAAEYRYTVTDIVLNNVYTSGDCAVPDHTWSNTVTGTYAGIADLEIASATTEECATEVLLIPGSALGISFNVNIEMKSGDDWKPVSTTAFSKNAVVTLAANSAYNLNLTVGLDNTIQFTVTQQPTWATNTDVTIQ